MKKTEPIYIDRRIFEAAESGGLVLTVNDRLARYLQGGYDREQQERGLSAWRRPDILSYPAWLTQCQKQLHEIPLSLNKFQLQHIWEKIVSDDVKQNGAFLLNIPQTARKAIQAHQLLVSHAADFSLSQAAEDHRAFLRWRSDWIELSARKGWFDPAYLPWRVAEAISTGSLGFPDTIILAGFDELTPEQKNLSDAFSMCGVTVDSWQPDPCRDVQRIRVEAVDPQEEVGTCARWVRRLLEKNPAARIAVVAPQLEAYRPLVERTFMAELEPESLLAMHEEAATFNLSLGHHLDEEEIVFAALRLLRFGGQVSQTELSWLLHTAYVGGAIAESEDRAALDRELQRLRRHTWPSQRLGKVISGLFGRHTVKAPRLIEIVELLSAENAHRKKNLPGYWVEHFSQCLYKLGWPGERGLSSREYQALQRFKSILGDMASLDSVSAPIERHEAVRLLGRMVSETDYQPEGSNAPVQVLGELEVAGLTFDHLWVLGLHDRAMPRTPSPNPFIPLPVQRKFRMKRADAEREYQYADQVARRLLAAAPDVVVSWPAQEEGAPQRPSPFITAIEAGTPEVVPAMAPMQLLWDARPALELLADDQAPKLSSRKPFSGGTGILKDQALCPFRAFAHHRLRAEWLDQAEIGIDSMSRGTLAHTVLELFWEEVEDRATLLSLDAAKLHQRVTDAVEKALDRLERERRHDIPQRQRLIEKKRLATLALRWLEVEKRRTDFRVMAAEKMQTITLGELSIRTRIDRIDELAEGRCAIIDYKTGLPDPLQWLDDRITEPQLPAYCLAIDQDRIGAVMFGVVRDKEKECGFRGLARDIGSWPGAGSKKLDEALEEKAWATLDEVLTHWETTLKELGDAFASGAARVDPVDYEKACKYCDLANLCRVSEQDADWQEGDDE